MSQKAILSSVPILKKNNIQNLKVFRTRMDQLKKEVDYLSFIMLEIRTVVNTMSVAKNLLK